jgi:phosphomannomutase
MAIPTFNAAQPLEPRYTCPGEMHSISRAVHLSRLAAFYPKCRECAHRHETGQLPQPPVEETDSTQPRREARSLFTLEGVRGVYLNELTRHKAAELASAFASLLWESIPLSGRGDLRDANSKRPARRVGPVVVVGFDERPSSPDLVTGVAAALRRMSCQIVDIGFTTVPCFRFAAAHLQAAGGILISGHGGEPAWTGLDFVGKGARPLSAAGRRLASADDAEASARVLSLDDLSERLARRVARPLRHGGTQRMFPVSVPYLAGLWKHFHALRPLKVAVGCPVRLVRRTLDTLFEKLPVALQWVEIPQRARDVLRNDDADVARLREAVLSQAADFGLLIDDDGINVAVLDERGQLLEPSELLCLIADVLLTEQPNGAVVLDNAARERLQPLVASMGARCWLGGWTQSDLWQTLRSETVICGGGASGRVWLRDTSPTADAILTLAKVLHSLSRDDAPLSEVVAAVTKKRAESANSDPQELAETMVAA